MLIGESWEYMGDMYHFDCSKEAYGIYWLIIEITDGHTNTYSLVYVELAALNVSKHVHVHLKLTV